MYKTKPVEIISTFSTEEIKEFSAFVRSPYFNTNKNLIKLFDAVKNDLKKIQAGSITEENIFSALFPGKEYNYGIMKNLVSSLAVLCEEFLIINSVRNNEKNQLRKSLLLAEEYDNRLLDRYFYKRVNKMRADAEKELLGSDYYMNYALMEEAVYFFNSSRSDDKALEAAVYNEIVYNLCDFYRKFSRSMWKIDINMGNINSKYEKDFIKLLNGSINFEKLTEELKGIDEKAYNYIHLNTLLIKLLKREEDTAPFYELKALIEKTIDQYENYERFSIFTKLLSYCSSSYRLGRMEFMGESLEIRMLMIEKVRFNYKGQGPFNFHNFIETVMMIILEKNADIAEEFLNKYFHVVAAEWREVTFNLAMAYIHEARSENSMAIEFLAKTAHADTDIKAWIKKLYIRIYYNTGEFESGLDAVSAYKSFVKGKNEYNAHARKNYLAFAGIMEKMFKIKCSPEKFTANDVNVLYNDVESNNYISRQWQLEKIDELKQMVN
jgi:hypothetical protein